MRCPYCGYTIIESPCFNCNELVSGIEWSKWPDEVHFTDDQIARQKRACNLPINSIDISACKAMINNHNTSLVNCKCGDFINRRLPCKHMYRLAFELNLFNL